MRYIVARAIGGEQGSYGISYLNPETIVASDREGAIKIYNEKNGCAYYYGVVLAEVNGEGFVSMPEHEFLCLLR